MKVYTAIAVTKHRTNKWVINITPVCTSLLGSLVREVADKVEKRLYKLYNDRFEVSVNMHEMEMDISDVDYAFMLAETRLLMTDPDRNKKMDAIKLGITSIDDVKSDEQDIDKAY